MSAKLRSALLWAGPLGVAAAVVLLLVSAPFFGSGPGTPTAGDERAWTAMWGALALVVAGAGIGVVANTVWLVWAVRARARPRARDAVRLALTLLIAASFAWLWFAR